MADADNHRSEIASSKLLVDREVLTLKYGAFLAQLLIEEVDLGESTPGDSHEQAVFSMRVTDGPKIQVRGARTYLQHTRLLVLRAGPSTGNMC